MTGISYAASTTATTSVSITSSDFANVSEADTNGKYESQPELTATGSTGTVNKGDLNIIEPNGGSGDIYGTLYLENASELSDYLTFLNFNIKVYGYDATDTDQPWTFIENTESMLSLSNGYVDFTIPDSPSYTKYSVSVENGNFYIKANKQDGIPDPSFYVEIR